MTPIQTFNNQLSLAVTMVNTNNALHRKIKDEAEKLISIPKKDFEEKVILLTKLLGSSAEHLIKTEDTILKLGIYASKNKLKLSEKTQQKIQRLFTKTQSLISMYKEIIHFDQALITSFYKGKSPGGVKLCINITHQILTNVDQGVGKDQNIFRV